MSEPTEREWLEGLRYEDKFPEAGDGGRVPGRWDAPWTDEQVAALAEYQANGRFHPYTCGADSSHGALTPTREGWVCESCSYSQGWAHAHGRVPDVSEQRAETAIWHGTPGHFIAAYSCCFRLHTTVGEYRVSTVGCYHSGGDRSQPPREIGSGRLYETMVFRNGPDAEPVDWAEIDGDAYSDELSAEAGHLAMCRKYGLDPASVLAALLAESPEATVAAIEALLTSERVVLLATVGQRQVDGYYDQEAVRAALVAACRSLLSKAPKEEGDA